MSHTKTKILPALFLTLLAHETADALTIDGDLSD